MPLEDRGITQSNSARTPFIYSTLHMARCGQRQAFATDLHERACGGHCEIGDMPCSFRPDWPCDPPGDHIVFWQGPPAARLSGMALGFSLDARLVSD